MNEKLFILQCSGGDGKPKFGWSVDGRCDDLPHQQGGRISQKKQRQLVAIFGGTTLFNSKRKAVEAAFAAKGWEQVKPKEMVEVQSEPQPEPQAAPRRQLELEVIDLKYPSMILGEARSPSDQLMAS